MNCVCASVASMATVITPVAHANTLGPFSIRLCLHATKDVQSHSRVSVHVRLQASPRVVLRDLPEYVGRGNDMGGGTYAEALSDELGVDGDANGVLPEPPTMPRGIVVVVAGLQRTGSTGMCVSPTPPPPHSFPEPCVFATLQAGQMLSPTVCCGP